MTDEDFEVTFGVDNGFVGGGGDYHCTIKAGDICGGESDDQLKRLLWGAIQREFENTHHPYCSQEDEFVAWARSLRADADGDAA